MKRAYNYSRLETWPLDPRSVAENHYYVLIFTLLGWTKKYAMIRYSENIAGLPNQTFQSVSRV